MRKHIISVGLLVIAVNNSAQTIPSSTENYVYSKDFLSKPGDPVQKPVMETIQYFDGLGRLHQIVNVKSSPLGNDVVTKIEYDDFGRQTKDYLPVPQTGSSNGAIYGNPLLNLASTPYGTEKIYSEKVLEASPLGRIRQQVQLGTAWSNKPAVFSYDGTAADVKKYTTTTSWSNNATSSVLTLSGNYGVAQLYKNTVTDEDGNTSYEFKNGEGQTLLVRKTLAINDGFQHVDTYYVYNEYNQLAFVISPEAAAKTALSQTDLDELCYQYHYDERNRLTEKKLPGKGWEYMVYDKQDRLVMTQDAKLGENKQWVFTKYDQFGRVAYTGIFISSKDYGSIGRDYEQGEVNGKGSNNVARTSSGFAQPGVLVYYDNLTTNNYPNDITKLLSVNYYDTYPTDKPNLSTLNFTQTFITDTGTNSINTKGLPTASYVNNVETNGWTKSYKYYDGKARPIATYSRNHLGGYTQTESFLDFAGIPQKVITKHKRRNSITSEIIIQEEFTYDNQNRLLTHTHEVVGISPKEQLVENHYNEIGQLDYKKVGGVGGNYLQMVNYSYNIRGWMTGINNWDIQYNANGGANSLNYGKLFGYVVRYNDPKTPSLGSARYNGNIAEIDWIYKNDALKRYGYQYDGLNRLLRGNYQDPGSTVPESHFHDEALTYDLNGNIKTLLRNTINERTHTANTIDNLDYHQYTGNRVTSIIDYTTNPSGYEGGGNTIDYDTNGNITAMPDKKISAIAYNFLNLPTQINQNANVTNYFYRADGVKVKKKFVLTNSSGTKTINTEYLDGFQYSTPNTEPIRKALEQEDDATMMAATAAEAEAFVPDVDRKIVEELVVVGPVDPAVDDMILSFFPTAEGYYDFENFRYIYQYKDHLGNVRLSYVKENNALKVMDTNNYYPFGMSFLKSSLQSLYDPMAIPYNYKYNGKELQETGMYDYGARMYMPDIGRWGTIDPLEEQYRRHSTYNYAVNNPILFIDPDGRGTESTHTDKFGNVLAIYNDGDNGVYKHTGDTQETFEELGKSWNLENTSGGGELMGETEYWDEFVDPDTDMAAGTIHFGDEQSWDPLVSDANEYSKKAGLVRTMEESKLYQPLDIKNNKDWAPEGPMTGRLLNGKYATGRSAGNYLAGLNGVTSTLQGVHISGLTYMKLAGAYQRGLISTPYKISNYGNILNVLMGTSFGPAPYYGEEPYSGRRILEGIKAGEKANK